MPVSSWSSNSTNNTGILTGLTLDGAVMTPPQIDNAFRDMAAQIAAQLGKLGFKGADMSSATMTNLANATGWYLDITGAITITAFGTVDAGQLFMLRFAGPLILTHNASSLILPGSADITTAAGDVAFMMSLGSGSWRCISYQRATGFGIVAPVSTDNALSRFDGTAGALQNSLVIVDDSGNVTGIVALTASGAVSTGALTATTIAGTTGTFSANITGNSDIRLKTNVETIEDALDILRRL